MIDNSNSNAATDCPNYVALGTFQTAEYGKCQSETNREAAVLAAYDVLQQVADNQPSNALAVSSLAIASFPTKQNYYTSAGWTIQTAGWVTVNAGDRAATASAMLFARQPYGMTPYGAAFNAAASLFKSAPADGRKRVAILITDGNATDSDPAAVAAQAAALRQAGVQVIALTYSLETTASDNADIAMMTGINNSQKPGTWYAPHYASFAAYITALIGPSGLMQTVSNHDVIQVSDSSALKDALMNVIQTKVIGCSI